MFELSRAVMKASDQGVEFQLNGEGALLRLGDAFYHLTWRDLMDRPPEELDRIVAFLRRRQPARTQQH